MSNINRWNTSGIKGILGEEIQPWEFDVWLDAEKAKAFEEGEQNVYIGLYDQYDQGSRMTRKNNPYRKD